MGRVYFYGWLLLLLFWAVCACLFVIIVVVVAVLILVCRLTAGRLFICVLHLNRTALLR